jgi:hypothetical protein
MFKVISTQTRPNSEVEFYTSMDDSEESVDFRMHWLLNYVDASKVIEVTRDLSLDFLTLTTYITWKDENTHLEAFQDPIFAAMIERRNAYNQQHGITVGIDKFAILPGQTNFTPVPNRN